MCEHCGEQESLKLPQIIDAFVKWGTVFMPVVAKRSPKSLVVSSILTTPASLGFMVFMTVKYRKANLA